MTKPLHRDTVTRSSGAPEIFRDYGFVDSPPTAWWFVSNGSRCVAAPSPRRRVGCHALYTLTRTAGVPHDRYAAGTRRLHTNAPSTHDATAACSYHFVDEGDGSFYWPRDGRFALSRFVEHAREVGEAHTECQRRRRLLCAAAGCDSGVTTQLVTEGALPIESRRRALAEAYRAAFEKALGGALAEAQRRLALVM